MRRLTITIFCALLLAAGSWRAQAFALLGPLTSMAGLPATYGDSWEVPAIGYDLGGDVGTPKNFNQGYRRNIPVMYYAFDASFENQSAPESGFFGLQGQQAVDSAMNLLTYTFTNNSTMSLDGYSSNLVEFPFNSMAVNTTAEGLGLTDLKSDVLTLMMEQLGLAEPERYTWTLHDRYLPSGGTCPIDEFYLVVQRNYYYNPTPLTQIQYSPYVNDTLYTYAIEEFCNPPIPPDAVTVPLAVDPYAAIYTAVASHGLGMGVEAITSENNLQWESIEVGGYYTGLTRDDVGGLRFLMSTNNVEYEDPGLGSELEVTNYNEPLLFTSPLYPLLQFAQTNPPAAVAAAYPNLVIDSYSNYYTLVTNWVTYSYFTNYPGSPASAPPVFVVGTNGYTLSQQTNYVYSFGNMVIVDYHTNTPAIVQTVTLGSTSSGYGGAAGAVAITTNVTTSTIILSNVISGDYFVLPTNSCGIDIIATNAANVFDGIVTNFVVTATNNASTNAVGFVASQTILVYLTNNVFSYYACELQSNSPAYYEGIGKIQFVRIPDNQFDSLTGNLRWPVTNSYTMTWYNPTNSQYGTRTFQRILTTPDILFAGADYASPNPGSPVDDAALGSRNVNFDINNIIPNEAGPGTINPPTVITFDTVGDIFGNGSLAGVAFSTNGFLTQVTQAGLLAWASFDGTTNPPVVYPNGASIQELENQLVITVTPQTLPDGTNGVAYPTIRFNVTGGQPPYTWQLADTGTQSLPTGLTFSGGVLAGTPFNNAAGAYDFTIQLTDNDNRVVTVPYTITIH